MVHVDESLKRVRELLGVSRDRVKASSADDVSGIRTERAHVGRVDTSVEELDSGKPKTTYEKVQASFHGKETFSYKDYTDLFSALPDVPHQEAERDISAFLSALTTEASAKPDKYTYVDTATGSRRAYTSVETVTRASARGLGRADDFVSFTLAENALDRVKARLKEDNVSLEEFEKWGLERRVAFSLASLYGDGMDEDEVSLETRRLLTTANNLKDAVSFFGQPSADKVALYDFGSDSSQMELLRAWDGPNKYMTNYVIHKLATDRSWALEYGLPLQRDDNLQGTEAEFIIFNHAPLGRSPQMSTGTMVQYRTGRYASLPVRFARSMDMTWDFYQTPRGRFMWGMHQLQIMNGTISTLAQGANVAMITCKGTVGDAEHNYDVDVGMTNFVKKKTILPTRDAVEMAVRAENMTWDRIHGKIDPLNTIMDEACRRINEQTTDHSGGESVTIDKTRMVMAVGSGVPTLSREVGIANDPAKTGKPRPEIYGYFGSEQNPDETKVMPGGWRLAESRKSRTFNGQTLEPHRNIRVTGHSAYSTGGAEWLDASRPIAPLAGGAGAPIGGGAGGAGAGITLQQIIDAIGASAAAYKTSMSDIHVWTGASDKLQHRRFQTLLEHNCLYETPTERAMTKRSITWLGLMALLRSGNDPLENLMDGDHLGYYPTYIDPVQRPSHYKNAMRRVLAAREVWEAAGRLRSSGRADAYIKDRVCTAAQFLGMRLQAFARFMVLRARADQGEFVNAMRLLTPIPGRALAAATVNSEAEAIAVLRNISMADSGFLDFAVLFDVPTGMRHEEATPFAQYVAKASLIWRTGNTDAWNANGIVSGIGRTQYASPSYMVSLDAQTRYYVANFHIWARSSVMQPAYLYIDKATYIEGYHAGHGGQLWTTQDRVTMFDRRRDRSAYDQCTEMWRTRPEMSNKSSYSLFMPPDAAPLNNVVYDITGAYSTDLLAETQTLHYPTALFYRAWWNFTVVNSVNRQDITHSQTYGNSILCEQYFHATEISGQLAIHKDKGVWGQALYPGYLTARKYPGTPVPPSDPKAKYV